METRRNRYVVSKCCTKMAVYRSFHQRLLSGRWEFGRPTYLESVGIDLDEGREGRLGRLEVEAVIHINEPATLLRLPSVFGLVVVYMPSHGVGAHDTRAHLTQR